jgi:hypothetical protein
LVTLEQRAPLFVATHLSTGPRRDLGQADMDMIVVDFWDESAETNGPHHSAEVIIPSHWPPNLLLSAAARSIRNRRVISIYRTHFDHKLTSPQATLNEVQYLFSLERSAVEALLNQSADLYRAKGGRRNKTQDANHV